MYLLYIYTKYLHSYVPNLSDKPLKISQSYEMKLCNYTKTLHLLVINLNF